MTRSPAARRGHRPDPPSVTPVVRAQRLVTVSGASGGLGASVLAAAVAIRAAAAGVRVAAVDLDPCGGGLDVTFGAEQTVGLRWSDLADLDGAPDGTALWAALPEADGVRVLSHSRQAGPDGAHVPHRPDRRDGPDHPEHLDHSDHPDHPDRVGQVVGALRAVCDLLVLDLPRAGHGGAGTTTVVAVADTVVLLAGAQLRQVAALTVVGPWLASQGRPDSDLVVCLRSERGDDDLREFVTTQLGLPVLGVLADDRGLRADLVHGVAPGTRRGSVSSLADVVVARAMLGEEVGAA